MRITNSIHPTAIVHSSAKICPNVHIGPYSIIEAGVEIGEGTVIGNHVTISGNTIIGKNNKIYHSSSIGEDPQDMKFANEDTRLIIGDNNLIREFCTINKGTSQDKNETRIGNNNWIMAYCHIAHDCILGDYIVMANSSTLGGHVEIHNHAVLGGATLVHQFCKIGAHVMTAGGSGIQKDVPPFVITHGNFAKPIGVNSEGLKRRNFNDNQLSCIKRGFKVIYRKDNSIDQALKELEFLANEEEVIHLYIDFIKKSTRGLIR